MAQKLSAFGQAFNNARKAGQKVFTFNGKKYNTRMAAETPRSAPTPTPRPETTTPANTPASTAPEHTAWFTRRADQPPSPRRTGVVLGIDTDASSTIPTPATAPTPTARPETAPTPTPRSEGVSAKSTSRPSYSGLTDVAKELATRTAPDTAATRASAASANQNPGLSDEWRNGKRKRTSMLGG